MTSEGKDELLPLKGEITHYMSAVFEFNQSTLTHVQTHLIGHE